MTTSGVAGATGDDSMQRMRLDRGPLAEAMAAVSGAVAGIEEAKRVLLARRDDLTAVLAAELEAVLDAGADDVVEEVRPVLTALYWDHADVIRVRDITDATGLTGAQLRSIVAPRRVELACVTCGTPTAVLQQSRSQHLRAECDACRWMPGVPEPWAYEVPEDPLFRLVEHLEEAVARSGCDGRFARTRAWAVAEGLDPDALVAEVRGHGAYCDCEVALHVPVLRWR